MSIPSQVLSLCCNHAITSEMMLEEKGRASWSWLTAADASDGSPQKEQFAIKFKTTELADKFKEVFLECQSMIAKESAASEPGAFQ